MASPEELGLLLVIWHAWLMKSMQLRQYLGSVYFKYIVWAAQQEENHQMHLTQEVLV